MALLARKRELSSLVPVAPIALPVSMEGEGENVSFLECEIIEKTPRIVGANNQIAGLAALKGINTKLDSRLPPPSSFSGSTKTRAHRPTGMVLHRAPEGSTNMQLLYSVSGMPQSSTTVQLPPAAARVPVGSASAPQINPPALSTGRAYAENETHLPGCKSMQ
ncbi:hypothetical protein H4S08_004712 [Coemansia sp. RSA 1365]|nr:hypothetical protein H4S08_004712 [Coemansia sp. RSA 1365]